MRLKPICLNQKELAERWIIPHLTHERWLGCATTTVLYLRLAALPVKMAPDAVAAPRIKVLTA
jgi:hypothetical protein